jgi:alkyldihydroxyacetonephosphate synthase
VSSSTDRALRAIAGVVGPRQVSLEPADRLAVSVDLWPRHLIRLALGESVTLPTAVVWPETIDELRDLVLTAQEERLTLVPYGAGSGVVGGTTPEAAQVVVDLKRMNRLLAIDETARTATAEAGIMGELLERQLGRRGFTQGHFPSSIYCSTLGGWIAAKSAGQMSSRYGKIEDQLLGGVAVFGDGRVLRQSASPVLDPIFRELIGAEGTLGIWAEATVRIHPVPAARVWRGFIFPSLTRAMVCVQAWLAAGLSPCVVRIYDPLDTLLHRQTHAPQASQDRGPSRLAWLGATFPRLASTVGDAVSGGCQCIIGVQGDAHECREQMRLVMDLANGFAAKDLGAEAGEAWYARRYAVSYGQSRAYRAGVVVDTMEVACAWSDIVRVYHAVRDAGLKVGAQVIAHFSHVYLEGGSIYFTYALPIAKGVAGYDRLWRECLGAALDAGANVSHHHGTGRLKAAALRRAVGGADELWATQRHRLDPLGTLNPTLFVKGPVREARQPPDRYPGPGLATAVPSLEVDEIEQSLVARGRSLGPAAELFGEQRLLDLARQGFLWRFNPQLRLIEPIVVGVDAEIHGRAHRYIPGPRSAMGPDLARALLSEQVERLWLKTEAVAHRQLQGRGELAVAVDVSRRILADETAGAGPLTLEAGPDGVSVTMRLVRTPRANAAAERAAVLAADLLPLVTTTARLNAPPANALFVAGAWKPLTTLLGAALDAGLLFVLPWTDAVGAVGFVFGRPELADQDRQRFVRLADELGVSGRARVEAAPSAPARQRPVEMPTPASAIRVALALTEHAAALDNCTYCPKLCRFACPVATAGGSETLTPRQLMLTANLVRTGRAPLDAQTLAPLWACVDCRGCRSFCDHGNDVATVLMQARAELFFAGAAPSRVRGYLRALRENGRPPDRPATDDVAGAVDRGAETATTWLFYGCQGSAQTPGPANAALNLVRGTLEAPRVLRPELGCCGLPLWRWGDRRGFAAHARRFAAQLKGATRLVVDDPGCAWALRVLYPTVGVAVPEVITTTALLAGARLGRLKRAEAWAPHDDEHAVRWLGEPSIRELMQRSGVGLGPGSVVEGQAGSCGGMLLETYDAALAERVARACVDDLLGGGAMRVLTSSPTSRRRLEGRGVAVDDLASLWYDRRQ